MPLDKYREKRAASATPEPFGAEGARAASGFFVVQKHAARHTHYDFRLEIGGVLVSWAVPKGPSLDPKEKRLAMKVEDHPVEYADFEGVIPRGNYGAGPVILWDRGSLIWLEEPFAGIESGKILFELGGYKLRGVFTLVRTKRKGVETNEWLLIKKPDRWAATEGARPLSEASVLSGLTVEQRGEADALVTTLVSDARALGAIDKDVSLERLSPMLAETAPGPFSREGWLFELKYDGWRVLAERRSGAARLALRKGSDASETFPEVARAIAALPLDVVIDGEVVVLDAEGKPDFHALQERAHLSRPLDIARAAVATPATYYAFDLLAAGGLDFRSLPLSARKSLLARVVPRLGPVRFADHVEMAGEALFAEVQKRGLEGVMAKRLDAPYRETRSDTWLKVKSEKTTELVIVGMTAPKGGRSGFGALELAYFRGDELIYAGRAGSGFSGDDLDELSRVLSTMVVKDAPCTGEIPREKGRKWVTPKLVCEVRFLSWTKEGVLRFPVFLRLREDVPPEACRRDDRPVVAPAPAAVMLPFTASLSNPKKVYWPDDGITKGDLVGYYRAIAPWLLPYLRDRPVVLTRYPDGIAGKSFFQHDAPVYVPPQIRTTRLFSEHAAREVDYFVLEDIESIAYVANLGTIPIHMWASRVASIQRPDFTSIDLDPKTAPFADVVTVALALRALCDEIGVPTFVKTSGQSGLHVLIPLAATVTHDQARVLAFLLARVITESLPDIATTARTIDARGGRVYLDTMQNGHGRTLVAPFAARPVAGAPVSMPLRWDEVTAGLSPRGFSIRSAVARMEALGTDPFLGILGPAPDLAGALAKLSARVKA